MRALVLVALLAACADQDAGACGMAFSPDPEIRDAATQAAARWSAATGCDVRVETGGLPVRALDTVVNPLTGTAACAITVSDARGPLYIELDTSPPEGQCRGAVGTLLHEMVHAMADVEHTETGVFAHRANGAVTIDEASLTRLCEGVSCTAFNPEH